MNHLVQSAVTLGVWYALLIDVLGNWEGQGHSAAFGSIAYGCIAVIVFVHAVVALRYR